MISFMSRVKFINTSLSRNFSIAFKLNMALAEMDEKVEMDSLKRKSVNSDDSSDISSKKANIEEKQERIKKRKVAMLISYLGQGYLGLQRNPGTKTIEEDLLVAMLKAGYINDDCYNQPQQMQFQRAARTDKGVSALRQVLSLRLPENTNTDVINEHLPEQIRAIGILRVTKGFNCKGNCDARTYSYMTPTFAFSPANNEVSEAYRLPSEVHDRICQVLKLYEGTHNFHNFTSKKLPTDPSAHRFMMSFTCGEPIVIDGMEFVTLKVKGQSFMLHQIRKMVGLTIAIVRGQTTCATLTRAWEREKLDIPIAPGLGLLLEEVHYDRYNLRYGNDGVHEPVTWCKYDTEVEDFRKKYILPTIVETEKKEKSMLMWLDSLGMHSFDVRTEHVHSELDLALKKNEDMLSPPTNIDALIAAAEVIETER